MTTKTPTEPAILHEDALDAAAGGSQPTETLSLNFTKITYNDSPDTASAGVGGGPHVRVFNGTP